MRIKLGRLCGRRVQETRLHRRGQSPEPWYNKCLFKISCLGSLAAPTPSASPGIARNGVNSQAREVEGRLRQRGERIRMRRGWTRPDTQPKGVGTPSPLRHRALPLRSASDSAAEDPAFLHRLCGIQKGRKGIVSRRGRRAGMGVGTKGRDRRRRTCWML